MKKFALSLLFICLSVFVGKAEDLTSVWEEIISNPELIVGPVDSVKTANHGFEKMEIALNSAPTNDDIRRTKRIIAKIDDRQKVASSTVDGAEVMFFMAPYNMAATEMKVLAYFSYDQGEAKSMFIIYGICKRENLSKLFTTLPEDILG